MASLSGSATLPAQANASAAYGNDISYFAWKRGMVTKQSRGASGASETQHK